jgi:hypothetical protein
MTLEKLYQTVSQRKRPEDVAEMILSSLGDKLATSERSRLEKAANGSLRRYVWGYTSMLEVFAKPVGAEKQIKKAIELFKLKADVFDAFDDPAAIEEFITATSRLIGKEYVQSNFVEHRLNKLQRQALDLDVSKRQYNKQFRLLKRLEEKLLKITQEKRKAEFAQIAKHGLVHHLTWEEFSKDENTACFIAYYTSRCNLRSQFTISGQQSPYDEIANMLFDRCLDEHKPERGLLFSTSEKNNATHWWAMAQVYPHTRVLAFLTDEQKGMLLGRWTAVLEDIAAMLKEVWDKSSINRTTMIVKRGNDSSTWNSTAGAWNKARDSWMNLVYSMGLEAILEQMCFGKVLRLMAGDVAAWHRQTGGKLDPNTIVWNELPLPWHVFSGKMTCTKVMVETACKKADLDPEKSGWIAPRPHGIVAFTPTPELVHGVSIANPFLAKVLKAHHYFSGKPSVRPIYPQYN